MVEDSKINDIVLDCQGSKTGIGEQMRMFVSALFRVEALSVGVDEAGQFYFHA